MPTKHPSIDEGQEILEQSMETGNHPITRRIKDMLSPAGNKTGLRCVLKGHKWRLGQPKELRFGIPKMSIVKKIDPDEPNREEAVIELVDDVTWACFCIRCGAGSYFDEPPQEVFEVDYWCYYCKYEITGEKIIEHCEEHLNETGRCPMFKLADQ